MGYFEREKQQNKIAEIETKRITEEKMESKAQSPEQTPPPSSHQISLLSPSYSSSDAIAPAHSTSSSLAAMQIFALGTAVSYVDAAGWEAAPSCGAGLWYGSDSVSDDDLGYFIGHHPGDFAFVMDLKIGDIVTVKDRYEQQETYDVTRVFNWSQNGYLADVLAEIGSWNESIILQTCVGDKQNIRIVFAERSVKD